MGVSRARRVPQPGTVLLGKLRVERLIGTGAMGVVLEATDVPLQRRVALKMMAPHLAHDAEQRQRFLREARAAARLSNEHVTRLIDVGELEDGTPFLIMEFLEGLTLQEILDREGPPPIDVAIDWMLQAVEGVAEAHRMGLVHRDLKPANLFLAEREGRASIVKVLDFGTVKDTTNKSARITETGATMGSPAYMAPEQVRADAAVDPRADVWGIGVSIYELVTGALPFGGEAASIPAILSAVLKHDPPPMRSVRSDVPEALDELVMRCLSKDPAARFSNAGDLHVALARLRATLPKTTRATKTVWMGDRPTPRRVPVAPRTDGVASTPTVDTVDASQVRARPQIPTDLAKPPAPPRRRRSNAGIFVLSFLAVLVVGSAVLVSVLDRLTGPPAAPSSVPAPPSAPSASADPAPPPPPASTSAASPKLEPAPAAKGSKHASPSPYVSNVSSMPEAEVRGWLERVGRHFEPCRGKTCCGVLVEVRSDGAWRTGDAITHDLRHPKRYKCESTEGQQCARAALAAVPPPRPTCGESAICSGEFMIYFK